MRTSRCAARSREWRALSAIDAVFVASVVAPAREDELAALVRERFGLDAQFVRSPAAALGVRNAYAEPQRLGVDRSRSPPRTRAPRLQVLASVGTALTIDALAADGEHLGGLIVPSPALMRRAVVAGTARVDACEGRYRDWPASTDDGVFSGALFAAAGAIERFRGALERRFDARAALVLGGGGSDELEPLLADVERAHDLVLHGLALWAQAAPSA
jgi:type III pantothenate kinase